MNKIAWLGRPPHSSKRLKFSMVVVYVLTLFETYKKHMAGIEQGRGWAIFLQGFDYMQDRSSGIVKGGSLCAERGCNFSNFQGRELLYRACRAVVFTDAIPDRPLIKVGSCILTVGADGYKK